MARPRVPLVIRRAGAKPRLYRQRPCAGVVVHISGLRLGLKLRQAARVTASEQTAGIKVAAQVAEACTVGRTCALPMSDAVLALLPTLPHTAFTPTPQEPGVALCKRFIKALLGRPTPTPLGSLKPARYTLTDVLEPTFGAVLPLVLGAGLTYPLVSCASPRPLIPSVCWVGRVPNVGVVGVSTASSPSRTACLCPPCQTASGLARRKTSKFAVPTQAKALTAISCSQKTASQPFV